MKSHSPDGQRVVKPFWSPLAAGVVIGLVLLLSFLLSGHGLGASGAVTHVVAGAGLMLAPEATQANSYLRPMVSDGNPIGSWITWEVLGISAFVFLSVFFAVGLLVGRFVKGV